MLEPRPRVDGRAATLETPLPCRRRYRRKQWYRSTKYRLGSGRPGTAQAPSSQCPPSARGNGRTRRYIEGSPGDRIRYAGRSACLSRLAERASPHTSERTVSPATATPVPGSARRRHSWSASDALPVRGWERATRRRWCRGSRSPRLSVSTCRTLRTDAPRPRGETPVRRWRLAGSEFRQRSRGATAWRSGPPSPPV